MPWAQEGKEKKRISASTVGLIHSSLLTGQPSRALEKVSWKSKNSHHKEYAQRRFMNEIFNPVPEDANRPLKVNSKVDRSFSLSQSSDGAC